MERFVPIFHDHKTSESALSSRDLRQGISVELYLESLQRMCILNCLRPDKITFALQDYVTEKLGSKFVEPPPFDLKVSYQDSSPSAPLIFVLVTGSDPTKMFYSFADQMGMGGERSPHVHAQ